MENIVLLNENTMNKAKRFVTENFPVIFENVIDLLNKFFFEE